MPNAILTGGELRAIDCLIIDTSLIVTQIYSGLLQGPLKSVVDVEVKCLIASHIACCK